jgi:hypothetical protein
VNNRVTDLAPIAGKLANSILWLASDKPGEVGAAVQAITHALKGIGADFHDLAARVEQPNGDLSDTEMEKLYTAGIEEGRRLEKRERASQYNGAPHFPSPRDMALHCYQNITELRSEWETEFVVNMAAWTRTAAVAKATSSPGENLH